MEEKLNEKFEESSLERIRKVAGELKKTGVKELRKENLIENDPSINGSTGSPFLEPSRAMPRDSRSSRVESRDEKTPNPEISIIERPDPEERGSPPGRPVPQKGEIYPHTKIFGTEGEHPLPGFGVGVKIAETALSDLIQEKMKLEKILQEINNLKGRICQKIEFIKTLERRKREIEKQSVSLREENPNFLGEVEKKLDNLKAHIK